MNAIARTKDFFKALLKESSTPGLLGLSAAVASFLAVLPLMSLHMVVILAVCIRFRLNKVMALAIQNVYMPPFTPFLCVELGHYLLCGEFLTEVSMRTVVAELHQRFWEWLVGSLVVAPVAAGASFVAVWGIAGLVQSRGKRPAVAAKNLSDTRGNRLGFGFFRLFMRVFGVRSACRFVHVPAFFYALFDGKAFRAARPYLSSRFPAAGGLALRVHFHRQIVELGRAMVLAHAVRAGLPVRSVCVASTDEARRLIADGSRGLVLVISHIGPWHAALPTLSSFGRRTNLLMSANANGGIARLFKGEDVAVIDNAGEFGGLLECVSALDRGEIVCIMGDRPVSAGENVVAVDVLGRECAFPLSPWALASRCGVPAVPVFAVGDAHDPAAFRVEIDGPIDCTCGARGRPHAADLRRQVGLYAAAIERRAAECPHQVFWYQVENDRKEKQGNG